MSDSRELRISRGFVLSLCLCWMLATATQDAIERYGRVPANADGIGKTYMGRQIAHVMGWQGAAWLERAEREREERSDLLLPMLALKPGMVVADIGAGTGYYSRRIADRVGPKGKVYAVDVQPEMAARERATMKRAASGSRASSVRRPYMRDGPSENEIP